MFEELERQQEETLATERGRSPSGVASVGGPAGTPGESSLDQGPLPVPPLRIRCQPTPRPLTERC
jgi:hypothetical protein